MSEEKDDLTAQGVEMIGMNEVESDGASHGDDKLVAETWDDVEKESERDEREALASNSEPGEFVRIEDLKEIIELIRTAEREAYERGAAAERRMREEQLKAELEATRNIWHNERLEEAEMERRKEVKAGEAFLSKIRPSVWER